MSNLVVPPLGTFVVPPLGGSNAAITRQERPPIQFHPPESENTSNRRLKAGLRTDLFGDQLSDILEELNERLIMKPEPDLSNVNGVRGGRVSHPSMGMNEVIGMGNGDGSPRWASTSCQRLAVPFPAGRRGFSLKSPHFATARKRRGPYSSSGSRPAASAIGRTGLMTVDSGTSARAVWTHFTKSAGEPLFHADFQWQRKRPEVYDFGKRSSTSFFTSSEREEYETG